jgi:hypothetical protein
VLPGIGFRLNPSLYRKGAGAAHLQTSMTYLMRFLIVVPQMTDFAEPPDDAVRVMGRSYPIRE